MEPHRRLKGLDEKLIRLLSDSFLQTVPSESRGRNRSDFVYPDVEVTKFAEECGKYGCFLVSRVPTTLPRDTVKEIISEVIEEEPTVVNYKVVEGGRVYKESATITVNYVPIDNRRGYVEIYVDGFPPYIYAKIRRRFNTIERRILDLIRSYEGKEK